MCLRLHSLSMLYSLKARRHLGGPDAARSAVKSDRPRCCQRDRCT